MLRFSIPSQTLHMEGRRHHWSKTLPQIGQSRSSYKILMPLPVERVTSYFAPLYFLQLVLRLTTKRRSAANRSHRERRVLAESKVHTLSSIGSANPNATGSVSLQLKPEHLRVFPPEDRRAQQEGIIENDDVGCMTKALREDWLPLFRGSAPYVAMLQHAVMVVHIPGRFLDPNHRPGLEGLLGDITLCALLGVQPVLVVSVEQRMAERLRAEENIIKASGPETLARMLKQEAGCACDEIERAFGSLGRDFLRHISAETAMSSSSVFSSSQLVAAVPATPTHEDDNAAYSSVAQAAEAAGLLGRVQSVDVAQIRRRLGKGDVICLTSLAASIAGGNSFYVPSEELAAEVSKQLESTKLIYFTRGQRIVDTSRNVVVPTLQAKDAAALVEYAQSYSVNISDKECGSDDADYTEEIISYLRLLVEALAAGTLRGHLIDPSRGALLQELYTTDGSGTLVSQDLYDGIRLASPTDVPHIFELIEPLMRKGLLRRRSGYEVERSCENGELFVWSRDGDTLGCAELHHFGEEAPETAELGCFVISPKCRGKGHGAVLLSYVERWALLVGVRKLFLLTTQTMQWFVEHGFVEAKLSTLPISKRDAYDVRRLSKVYVKQLDAFPRELQERFTFVEVDHL